jgi:hypothetical protein
VICSKQSRRMKGQWENREKKRIDEEEEEGKGKGG